MFTFFLLGCILLNDDQETVIGPDVGKPAPALKVFQATGDQAGKDVNGSDVSKDRPTLFVFVNSEKWDRPVARFLKKLDERLSEARQNKLPNGQVAIVWLTKDSDKAREYLPRAQQSLKLEASTWNVFSGDAYDAQGWVLSGDAVVNVVVVKDNKVTWGRAYKTANDTTVRPVLAAVLGDKK